MNSCSDSIREYLFSQEKIKQNMSKLVHKCPEKVLHFILTKESKTTSTKLINCTWADSIDKKHIIKLLKDSCEDI